jgi:hypothetical protein
LRRRRFGAIGRNDFWRLAVWRITAFLFPILLKDIGTFVLLMILVGTSLLGAVVTWRYAFETKGVNLEKMDEKAVARPT